MVEERCHVRFVVQCRDHIHSEQKMPFAVEVHRMAIELQQRNAELDRGAAVEIRKRLHEPRLLLEKLRSDRGAHGGQARFSQRRSVGEQRRSCCRIEKADGAGLQLRVIAEDCG